MSVMLLRPTGTLRIDVGPWPDGRRHHVTICARCPEPGCKAYAWSRVMLTSELLGWPDVLSYAIRETWAGIARELSDHAEEVHA